MKRTLFKSISVLIAVTLIAGMFSIIPVSAVSIVHGDYRYNENEDGTVTIVKYIGTDKNVTMPSTINGKTVSAIDELAFYLNSDIEFVKLPSNLVHIEGFAFSRCENLKEMVFPNTLQTVSNDYLSETNLEKVSFADGITKIPDKLLQQSRSITEITLPASVTEIGEAAFYQCGSLSKVNMPKNLKILGKDSLAYTAIKSITIPKGIEKGYAAFHHSKLEAASFEYGATYVPDGIFRYCTSLINVTIPRTVTKLGNGIFDGCTSLVSLTLPGSITEADEILLTFDDSSIKTITISSGMKKIPDKLFARMKSLETINLPNTITEIGKEAFTECTSLKSITFPASITKIGEEAFCESGLTEVTIPKTLTTFDYYVFRDSALEKIIFENGTVKIPDDICYGATNLKTISFPTTVKEIGDSSFANCRSLSAARLPASLEVLGGSAFGGCTSLKSITIPKTITSCGARPFGNSGITTVKLTEGITKIFDAMFYDCKQLTSFNFPSTLTEIGLDAFRNCESLKTITIPKRITTVGNGAFAQSGLISGSFEEGTVDIPANVFSGCNSMQTITMPDTVKTIGKEAFWACNQMETIKLSSSLETIDTRAFFHCKALKKITFPDSVKKTNTGAFYGCIALEEVNFNENIQEINGFGNCSSLKSVVIPKNAKVSGSSFGVVNDQVVEDFIIYGYRDSYAQKYAKNKGIRFIALDGIVGDVNGDGIVDITDATCVQKYCVNLLDDTQIQKDLADVDGNGLVNVADATAIQKMLVA